MATGKRLQAFDLGQHKQTITKKLFCFAQHTDNELITLEVIHRYVELLDKYFGSVRYFSISSGLKTWTVYGKQVTGFYRYPALRFYL